MSDTEDSDEALMARYGRGDAAAFESLYRRHELKIWRYLKRNVGNEATAEELMQDVWFAVARDACRYQPSARFTTWLFTIAHHRMVDSLRTLRRHVSLDAPEDGAADVAAGFAADPRSGPLEAAVAHDQALALNHAVGELPIEQRNAFLLQIEGELSVEEVAAITHSSFETTKSRLRYARDKLRALLKEHA